MINPPKLESIMLPTKEDLFNSGYNSLRLIRLRANQLALDKCCCFLAKLSLDLP
jgi:hypothetical protein